MYSTCILVIMKTSHLCLAAFLLLWYCMQPTSQAVLLSPEKNNSLADQHQSNRSVTKGNKLILNVQHAFRTNDHWALFLSSALVISAVARVLSNSVASAAIFKHKALRTSKAFLLIGLISVFDFIQGIHHLNMFLFHYGISSTRLQCLFTVRNITHLIAEQNANMTLALISFDRLLAVTFPLWHYKQTVRYIYKMVGVMLACSFLTGMYALYFVVDAPYEIVPHCYTTHTFKDGFYLVFKLAKFWLFTSCLVYGMVVLMYKNHLDKRLNKVASETTSKNKKKTREFTEYKERLHRLTVTLGISALVTLLMNALPRAINLYTLTYFPAIQQHMWLSNIPIDWSTVANLFLYMKRQPEFMKGLVALFKFKQLPDSLSCW